MPKFKGVHYFANLDTAFQSLDERDPNLYLNQKQKARPIGSNEYEYAAIDLIDILQQIVKSCDTRLFHIMFDERQWILSKWNEIINTLRDSEHYASHGMLQCVLDHILLFNINLNLETIKAKYPTTITTISGDNHNNNESVEIHHLSSLSDLTRLFTQLFTQPQPFSQQQIATVQFIYLILCLFGRTDMLRQLNILSHITNKSIIIAGLLNAANGGFVKTLQFLATELTMQGTEKWNNPTFWHNLFYAGCGSGNLETCTFIYQQMTKYCPNARFTLNRQHLIQSVTTNRNSNNYHAMRFGRRPCIEIYMQTDYTFKLEHNLTPANTMQIISFVIREGLCSLSECAQHLLEENENELFAKLLCMNGIVMLNMGFSLKPWLTPILLDHNIKLNVGNHQCDDSKLIEDAIVNRIKRCQRIKEVMNIFRYFSTSILHSICEYVSY